MTTPPNKIRLTKELLALAYSHHYGKTAVFTLPAGEIGTWNRNTRSYDFLDFKSSDDWLPYIHWSKLEKQPDSWEPVTD